MLTRPTVTREHLKAFYRKVHPGGPGWRQLAAECPEVKPDSGYLSMFWCWLASAGLIYGVLFGIGKIILQEYALGAGLLAFAAVMVFVLYRTLSKVGWEQVIE